MCTCVNGRRLKMVPSQLTPAHRVQVRGLTVHPLVILVLPAVEVDPQQPVDDAGHRGDTDEPRLHEIHGLQLHPGTETVVRDFLLGQTSMCLIFFKGNFNSSEDHF